MEVTLDLTTMPAAVGCTPIDHHVSSLGCIPIDPHGGWDQPGSIGTGDVSSH